MKKFSCSNPDCDEWIEIEADNEELMARQEGWSLNKDTQEWICPYHAYIQNLE